jgi:hypothetical protein
VERGAVEISRVLADIRQFRHQFRRAGRQECEVSGVRNDVIFVFCRQVVVDDIDAAARKTVEADAVVVDAGSIGPNLMLVLPKKKSGAKAPLEKLCRPCFPRKLRFVFA